MTTIETSRNIPGKLSKKSKLIVLIWLVTTVVLINGYKGIVVSELTAKPKYVSFWKNISETDNFVFFYDGSFINDGMKRISYMHPFKDWGKIFGYKFEEIPVGRGYLAFPSNPEFVDFYCRARMHNYTHVLKILEAGSFHLPLQHIDHYFFNLRDEFGSALLQYKYNKTYLHPKDSMKALLLCHSILVIVLDKQSNGTPKFQIMPFKNAILIPINRDYYDGTLLFNTKSEHYHDAVKMTSNCNKNGFIGIPWQKIRRSRLWSIAANTQKMREVVGFINLLRLTERS